MQQMLFLTTNPDQDEFLAIRVCFLKQHSTFLQYLLLYYLEARAVNADIHTLVLSRFFSTNM